MKPLPQYPHVIELLPHNSPMALLSRIVDIGEEHAACEIDIDSNSLFFEKDRVPVYVGLEYMAQTIAAFSGAKNYDKNKPPTLGFLLGGPQTDFHTDGYFAGQTLHTHAKIIWNDEQLYQFECSITDAQTNKLLATSRISAFSPNKEVAEIKEQKGPQ